MNMENDVFIIAEIGQAHNGSIDMAHSYIDALSKTGINAIKFQTHIAEAESSMQEPFRIQFTKQYSSRYKYWKAMEFTKEEWVGLKTHCDAVNIEFMSSPFSNKAVDLLEEIGVKRYKLGSGEVTNLLLLERIAKTNKPIILSSGMSSLQELDETVAFAKRKGLDFSILQCTTAYPTSPEQYGLNMIHELKERYGVSIGYSDHSSKIETGIAAVALGAEILEFHVVFDKDMFGPDSSSSLTILETKQLVSAIRNITLAKNNPIDKNINDQFTAVKSIFEKSLAVNKSLPEGHIITYDDLEAKKPKGYGIPSNEFQSVIGKKLNKDLAKWDFINHKDIHN